MELNFEIKKEKQVGRGPYAVYENGLRIFEGNEYQCGLYVKARKQGFSILDSTTGAAKRQRRPYEIVKIYLD